MNEWKTKTKTKNDVGGDETLFLCVLCLCGKDGTTLVTSSGTHHGPHDGGVRDGGGKVPRDGEAKERRRGKEKTETRRLPCRRRPDPPRRQQTLLHGPRRQVRHHTAFQPREGDRKRD